MWNGSRVNNKICNFLFCAICCFFVLTMGTMSAFAQSDCTFNGIPLYGKVKIVEHFPDIKVQKVQRLADLHVKIVDSLANSCGEWELVDSFPDFTVQFVEHFPDITIELVDHFPGMAQ